MNTRHQKHINSEATPQHINILHQNIQSLRKKIPDIEVFLENRNKHKISTDSASSKEHHFKESEVNSIDLLCFSEHWLTEDNLNAINLTNYKKISSFSRTTYTHGGVSIFASDKITNIKCREDINKVSIEKHIELAGIEINLSKNKRENAIVIVLYRSTSGDIAIFFRNLEYILGKLATEQKQIILVGDFNITFNTKSNHREKLVNLCSAYNLSFAINEPTRVDPHHFTENTIDNIATNIPLIAYSTKVINNCISDHFAQILTYKVSTHFNTHIHKKITRKKFSETNITKFRSELNKINWTSVYESQCPNTKYEQFETRFLKCFNECFPDRTIKVKRKFVNHSWITSGIRTSSKNLKCLYYLNRHFKTPFTMSLYKMYKNRYEKVLKAAKKQEINRSIKDSDNKTKKIWQIINQHTNKSSKINNNHAGIHLKINENKITEQQEISDAFNYHFATSVKNATNHLIADTGATTEYLRKTNNAPINSVILNHTSEEEIKNIVSKMKNLKSSGLDQVPVTVIKKCIDIIAPTLTHIFNASIHKAIFPDKLKISKIIPLFKKGDTLDINNYRPISLLSVFSKIFEKIIFVRLTSFLEKECLLSNNQNGFRKYRSTINTIDNFINKVSNGFEYNAYQIGIFCDLSKAFDAIDHKLLLSKLHYYGIRGQSYHLIKSYITGRTQHVQLKSFTELNQEKIYLSKALNVQCGVPQGSILGPLLFILYINDLASMFNNNIELFADDTSIYIQNKDHDQLLKDSEGKLSKISKWFQTNKLLLNTKKTHFIEFSTSTKKRVLNNNLNKIKTAIGNIEINKVMSTNFLGIEIDELLNWHIHCDTLAKKLSSACFALKTIKSITDVKTAKIAYYANFESVMRYGIEIWGNSTKDKIIFKIQKRAIRIILGLKQDKSTYIKPHCKPHFIKHKILTFYSLYIYQSVIHIKKNIHNQTTNSNIHSHNTRQANDIYTTFHKRTLTQHNSNYINSKLYNKLPATLKNITSITCFKNKLKEFLSNKAYYSIEEYLIDKH